MKSISLTVVLFSIVLIKAENCGGFGYELIMTVLESIHNNTRSSEHELRSVATKVNQLQDGQSQLIDHTKTFARKLDQLIDLSTAGEPRCPENAADGVYKLKPVHSSIPPFSVYCENGWIVIHRRFNGSLDFNRNWVPYREGFGDLQGEHWLGLEKMHQITRVGSYELSVIMKSFDDVEKTAKYGGFKIGSEFEHYPLNLERFDGGDAGDSFTYHNRRKFSTSDRNNDMSNASLTLCAINMKSGWWFKDCHSTNLNGIYEKGKISNTLSWRDFKQNHECLKEARMLIRDVKPKN